MAKSLIDSYDFGFMVINGKRYKSEVIVFPEKVISGCGEKKAAKFTWKI